MGKTLLETQKYDQKQSCSSSLDLYSPKDQTKIAQVLYEISLRAFWERSPKMSYAESVPSLKNCKPIESSSE